MNNDAAIILTAAAATIAAAAPQAPLSDMQVLIISAACGAIGGVVATLMSEEVITLRGFAMRGLASVLVAPFLVTMTLLHLQQELRLLTVAAASGVMGLCAWPIAQALPRIAPAAIKAWLSNRGAHKP